MKTPVVLVTLALAAAILLTASLLIATGSRGAEAPSPFSGDPPDRTMLTPAAR
jgi:hypothetical protein